MEGQNPLIRGASVLIVDDKPDQRLLYKLIMERLGVEPVIVASGEEALSVAADIKFDIAIMDWQMPDMDGVECQRRLRLIDGARDHYTPVVCATARVMAGDREKAMESGMDEFMGKPFTIEELQSKLGALLSKQKSVGVGASRDLVI